MEIRIPSDRREGWFDVETLEQLINLPDEEFTVLKENLKSLCKIILNPDEYPKL